MKYVLLLLLAMVGGPILFFAIYAVWARRYSRRVLGAIVERFYEENDGRFVFVGTRRHGWGDFLQNNVLPRLPAGVRVAWFERRDRDHIEAISAVLKYFHITVSKPLLLRVVRPVPLVVSLHEQLLPFKQHSARAESTAEPIRAAVDAAMVQLRGLSVEDLVN